MSSLVLTVLAAFVLVCTAWILRAFFRVQGEPILLGGQPEDLSGFDSVARELPPSPPPQPAPPLGDRQAVPGVPLDRQTLETLKHWYAGRECAVCRQEIGFLPRADRRPGLLSAGSPGEIKTWDTVPPDQVKAVLDSHLPVCSSCVLADSFRRRFPDRVTDRSDTAARERAFS
jgi:hypothetical protein